MHTTRRKLLKMSGYAALAAPFANMSSAFGAADPNNKMILIYLRGGCDAMNMLAPVRVPTLGGAAITQADIDFFIQADPRNYTRLGRGGLLSANEVSGDPNFGAVEFRTDGSNSGISAPGLPLTGASDFTLNPSLANFQSLFNNTNGTQLSIVMGTSGQNNRSHFKAQDATERALPHGTAQGSPHGWMYDAMYVTGGGPGVIDGFSIGAGINESLRGPSTQGIASAGALGTFDFIDGIDGLDGDGDADYRALLNELYPDEIHASFRPAREAGKWTLKAMDEMRDIYLDPNAQISTANGRWSGYAGNGGGLRSRLQDAARLAKTSLVGPKLITVDYDGWDTHSGQLGRQGMLLANLDRGIGDLVAEIGEPAMANVCIVVMSEFGRTFDMNQDFAVAGKNPGTDHGDATCMFVVSGSAEFQANGGGKILNGDKWKYPTKESVDPSNPINVHQWKIAADSGRYYAPIHTDFRSVYADILTGHFGLSDAPNGALAQVFGSAEIVSSLLTAQADPSDDEAKPAVTGRPGLFQAAD